MEEESHIWSLITKKFSGEATEKELHELQELLRKQPSWQYAYEMLSNWWSLHEYPGMDIGARESFAHLKEQLSPRPSVPEDKIPEAGIIPPWEMPRPRRRLWRSLAMAAGMVLVLGISGIYFYHTTRVKTPDMAATLPDTRLSEISTRYGSKSKVTLPDGTIVWLNSGSNLTYSNNHFGESGREVTLTGEAYFDVVHDTEHPFLIHAGKINIYVLGTAFDVKSYPEDQTIETTLIRGAIEITINDQPGKKLLLKPQQKLTVFNDDRMALQNLNPLKPDTKKEYKITPMTVISSDSTVVETSWVQNKLAFRSQTFSDLAVQLERWYNVDVNFTGSTVKQYKFTGIFVNESLDQALKALQITAPFNYRIEKNEVYISKP